MLDRRVLKIIAIVTMIIDHIGYLLGDNYFYLRYIGRLSFPIFLFLIVEGYFKTKNYKKYIIRLITIALISEIPFNLFRSNKVLYPSLQNTIWLFVFILLMFKVFDFIKKADEIYLLKICYYFMTISVFIVVTYLLNIEYSVEGILLSSSLYLFKDYKIKYLLFISSIVIGSFETSNVLGVFSLIFILLYNDKKVVFFRLENLLYYLIYPVQFLLLYVTKM